MFLATLLTPEGLVLRQEVERLHLPGEDGELDILAHHTPLIISLKPGVVAFHLEETKEKEDQHFFIWGGVANIQLGETLLLAQKACPLEDFHQEELERRLQQQSLPPAENALVQAQLEALHRYRFV